MNNDFEGLLVVGVIIVADICIITLIKLLKPLFEKPQQHKGGA